MRKGNRLYPSNNRVQEEKKKCISDSPTRGELDPKHSSTLLQANQVSIHKGEQRCCGGGE